MDMLVVYKVITPLLCTFQYVIELEKIFRTKYYFQLLKTLGGEPLSYVVANPPSIYRNKKGYPCIRSIGVSRTKACA